jgi:sugar phosphate isomerase/epimerase
MPAIGVAHLTALQLSPAELARQAARAGFSSIGLRLSPAMEGGLAYPINAASQDLSELRRVLDGEGVSVYDIEFVPLLPEVDVRSYHWLLEAGAELGARCLTVSGDDADTARLTANFALFCQLADPYGLRIDLEFMRWRHVGNLQQAIALVEQADQSNGTVLVDALHLFRSGGDAATVAAQQSRRISAVQLCDAPWQSPAPEGIIAEAREGRLAPGAGGLPLAALLRALPADIDISVEMPMPQLPAAERLALAFQSTQALLKSLKR